MKLSTLKKIKSPILNANKRTIRVDGKTYLIRAQSLGESILADAELLPSGGMPINLFGKTAESKAIRAAVEANLFS